MKTVLVIENNLEIRENIAELLVLEGFEVLTAERGTQGYQLAKAKHPNIVLCDEFIPETSGLHFLKLIKTDQSTAKIPLIFFSAGGAPNAVSMGIEQGADVYLSKPFTDKVLLSTLRSLINGNS
ncbi:MAG: response regulator [Saprospiraceae bacterium]|nr:response regulator [Saprospiraceae bacterium]